MLTALKNSLYPRKQILLPTVVQQERDSSLSDHFRPRQKTLWDQYQKMNTDWSQYRLNVQELHWNVESRINANSLLVMSQTTCLKNAYTLNKILPIPEFFCQLLTSRKDGMGSERPARRDRPDSSIWLICVLTATLIITGICWRIHVLQIRQSQIRAEPTYTLRWREYQDICGFITSIRDQACSQDWIKNEDRSYFLSTLATYYDKAKKHCSNLHAKLLEINSKQEETPGFRH
ncbi:uncharacterized protein [Hemitrygon akajei]|uniref:uncharacterized protein n=1 Tax=Hemitrygon akajei TaxID=2704970 RepID=UPI003BF9755E